MLDPTTTGSGDPSVASQLSTCVNQMDAFLSGAGSATGYVTRLKLNVKRRNTDIPPPMKFYYHPRPNPSPFAPSSHLNLYQVSRTALTKLAAAVPQLQHLWIEALYGEVDLSAFGAHCPALTHLVLTTKGDAMVLQGIDIALPALTNLVLARSNGLHSRPQPVAHVQAYYNTACLLLQGCTNLTTLTLTCDEQCSRNDEVDCPKEMWDQLPANLTEWHSIVNFTHMLEAASFMSQLRILVLGKMPCDRMPELLQAAPKLESLTIHRPWDTPEQIELLWSPDIQPQALAKLKAQLRKGFKLQCESVSLRGSSEAVREMLEVLPAHANVCRLCVDLEATVHVLDCLTRLLHVFPSLEYLVLWDCSSFQQAPWVDESFLTPLFGCSDIARLDVHLQVTFTYAGMVSLCMNLPDLEIMYCWPCEGMCYKSVMEELAAQGREVDISEIVEGEDLPEAYGE